MARLLREYETIIVIRPDATEEISASVRERVESVIEKLDGVLIAWDDWGKRRLGYEVRDRTGMKRHSKGIYVYIRSLGAPDLIPELERNFRMLEPVLKYLTIKLDVDVDPEERTKLAPVPFVPRAILPDMPRFDDDEALDDL
jgi:small subunit ribosomal protein S6